VLPQEPTFASYADERLYRKRRLAAAFRLMAKFGLSEGVAGHITVRDPEFHDRYWVNTYGMHFSRVKVSTLACMTDDGEMVSGTMTVNAAAAAIHGGLHGSNPHIVAAVHTHTVYGRAFAALNVPLEPISQEAATFFENQVLFDGNVVILGLDEGHAMGLAIGEKKAAILVNHGLLTVGSSVDAAAYRFIAMERACQVQLLAMAAGQLRVLPVEQARDIRAKVGSDYAVWYAFQALFDMIVEEQPDLLD
jgi:ribulose-5-phosphate 4-epimerase/fuculose-1-phosphate aldolase